jgi:hypothetical protein
METVLIESTDNQVVIKIDRHHIEPTYLDDLLHRLKVDLVQHQVSVKDTDVVLDGDFDTYQATMPVLARDWDASENDHWDTY